MTYVEGFVVAVPTANKEAYRKHAADAAPLFKEFGVARMVECWGDDVPDGKVNDFKGAVQAKPDETVVFSWFEYPDKATRDAANQKMMSDPRMAQMGGEMPFDGKRMIIGGFDSIVDDAKGGDGKTGYADGYIVPVPDANKEAYRELAQKMSGVFIDYGATRVVEAWADDVPDGKVTDYARAAHKKDDESVVYSWVEWPSKEARTQGWEKMMADERMKASSENTPFDGARMIYGGFAPIVEA
ncbi:MAG: DUF1428 domain-containing protein [Sphingopyxis sp.]|jgi:uncharacterized protein YbaA (DUF1428 family)|uniref:DUF1428 domain-containing protein n=1 Tax=unclassified Sphingopyxis TaxID=2614943 RepID=UPI0007304E34|nr:hypothetical protein ATE78_04905 [Sphingopyxis sp. H012]KTE09182.1 hypothetical protein ATE70_15095 [Sphingopyxis sp. H053]KTE14849.1 hypothetical protein ATE76_06575 [Sphingopyxis sp. H093]KTE29236.1 hypothetical protein ATE75_08835 [Sphingopyxis sp. H080]KTE35052.1 hypothetical protein ATE68_08495 [Sphingopyxis sp. H038]KTE43915.1 hypothetical protein ATE77_10315 [Sphingopyxis sp. H005]KTE47875.1 hypothetical protein ATE73_05945 [Sphingopyxis sp. H077]KTE69201.1 hypothetical protein ATE